MSLDHTQCRRACFREAVKQLTVRAPDDVVDAVHRAARQAGRSSNEWVTFVLRAATDPELAGNDALRIQERLRAVGILDEPGPAATRGAGPAGGGGCRQRAGRGRPLADFVAEGRGG